MNLEHRPLLKLRCVGSVVRFACLELAGVTFNSHRDSCRAVGADGGTVVVVVGKSKDCAFAFFMLSIEHGDEWFISSFLR